MNLNKILEFFDARQLEDTAIHLIGVGAIGGFIAEHLARIGIKKVHIWDFDTVDPHNVTNQIYTNSHIGLNKTDALEAILLEINPDMVVVKHGRWEKGANISGHVFLGVDSISTRREFMESNKMNFSIRTLTDIRMGLLDAQAYFVKDWKVNKEKNNLIALSQFSSEEVKEAVSACGTTLSVAPTIRLIVAVAVANWMNSFIGKPTNFTLLTNAFTPYVESL